MLQQNVCQLLDATSAIHRGSGCGSVGRAVASDTKDSRFESSHRQILFANNCVENMKIKKKRPEWPIFKKGSKSFWHQSEYGLIPKINEKEAGAGPFLKKDLPQVYTKGRFTLKDILLHC